MASNVTPAAVKPPRENLYRAINNDGAVEYREDATGGPVLSGHAAVFNTFTEINSAFEGHFLERIAPGAFAKTISENRNRIRVLFQHGRDPMVGDKPLGPLRTLEEDETGLRYEVDLLPTSYNADLEPGLRAGLYGASFRFSTVREDFNQRPKRSDFNPAGLPERTLQEVRLMELGPVTFGAYPQATAGVRSITDDVLRWQLGLEPEEIAEHRAKQAVKDAPVRVFFNGRQIAGDVERADTDGADLLQQMIDLGTQFIGSQAGEPDAAEDQQEMNDVLATLAAMLVEENNEPDPDADADAEGAAEDLQDHRAVEPEPSAATTPVEPEPSAATTRSVDDDLFWFVANPKLKGAKSK